MEVMHRAIVKSRTLKPLPGEITNQRINDATLPVKIEAARRAIAECIDLPELLRYKSQAEGLAAAVRTMKEVGPAMIRSANEMMADAWRKGGELLSAYSSLAKNKGNGGKTPSPRSILTKELGITKTEEYAMIRIAAAPKPAVYSAVQTSKNIGLVSRQLPAVVTIGGQGRAPRSDTMRSIYGQGMVGLVPALQAVRRVPLGAFKQLTPDERKDVKAKITEIVELLDEMDRLCR